MTRWWALVLVALAAVAIGCGGAQKRVRDNANRTEEYLDNVLIEGNVAIETDDLVPGLLSHRAEEGHRPLDPYQLSVDADRVRAAYQKLGYFGVDVKTTVTRVGLAQTAHIIVVEGKRAKSIIVVDGLPPGVTEAQARDLIQLKEGAPFDYDLYDDSKQPLLVMIGNAGYAHATMDAEVLADKTHAQATVRFVIDAGPMCAFGPITIRGIDGQLANSIRLRLAFAEGDRFSSQALQDTQRDIYEIGRFANVRVEPDRSGDKIVPVTITVVPANRYESKLGGGFGYEPLTFEARARTSFSAAGIPGPLWNAAIDFRPAYTVDHDFNNPQPKIRVIGTLSRMDLLDTLIKGEIELGYNYLTLEAYTSYGPHARLGLSGPIGYPWLRLRVGWFLEQLSFQDISPLLAKRPTDLARYRLDRNERVGEYQAAIVADLRDEPLSPRKGVYLELRANDGTPLAGSQLHFIQITPEVRFYVPLFGALDKSVIAMRARVGMIFGDVPVTERYYSGGASSQRGFSERHLSPYVDGVPIGGAGAIESGIELRTGTHKHLGLQLGGVLFLDAGDVTDTVESLDPWHLNYAAGGGVRIEVIKSIVIRLDLGFRLNRTGADEAIPAPSTWDRIAFHLGVGQAY